MGDEDCNKIRKALEVAAELLKKKKEEIKIKKEYKKNDEEEDDDDNEDDIKNKRPLYKKVFYIGLGVIFAIFIFLLIIYVFTRNTSSNVYHNNQAFPLNNQYIIPNPNNTSSFPITSAIPQRMGGGMRRRYFKK